MSHNQERAFLQEIWRKANREGELRIRFPLLSDARRVRFMLYNMSKSTSKGIRADDELLAAFENCSISVETESEDPPVYVTIIRHKMQSRAMQIAAGQLGIDLNNLPSGVAGQTIGEIENRAVQSQLLLLERMRAEQEKSEANAPVNPAFKYGLQEGR